MPSLIRALREWGRGIRPEYALLCSRARVPGRCSRSERQAGLELRVADVPFSPSRGVIDRSGDSVFLRSDEQAVNTVEQSRVWKQKLWSWFASACVHMPDGAVAEFECPGQMGPEGPDNAVGQFRERVVGEP